MTFYTNEMTASNYGKPLMEESAHKYLSTGQQQNEMATAKNKEETEIDCYMYEWANDNK